MGSKTPIMDPTLGLMTEPKLEDRILKLDLEYFFKMGATKFDRKAMLNISATSFFPLLGFPKQSLAHLEEFL